MIDRHAQLDLTGSGSFTLQAYVETPQSIGSLTLYFHSGGGWYAAGAPLPEKGWQTLRFAKISFGVEDHPAGWGKIDGIRIAAWRGEAQSKDTSLRIRRLVATTHDVALVTPTKLSHDQDQSEMQTAHDAAARIAAMLDELGLGSDAVDDAGVLEGALQGRRIAVLPYHPRLSDEAVTALVRFVQSGGKLLVCYTLPPRLATALGFDHADYVPQQRQGQFAEIRFDAPDISGLPQSIRQDSWNITAAQPAGYNARVIGRWYDDAGKATGKAAMLLSDRGALFSHVILGDDHDGKKQLLAAVLGHFWPPLWRQMARRNCMAPGGRAIAAICQKHGAYVIASGDPAAQRLLRAATATLAAAGEQLAAEQFVKSIELAAGATNSWSKRIYDRNRPAGREGRAMWNHSGTGAYPGDWDRSARSCWPKTAST